MLLRCALNFLVASCSIEAVCADFAFRESDRLYDVFDGAETEGCQSESFANFFDETVVFRAACFCIFVEVGIRVAFKLGYDTASD